MGYFDGLTDGIFKTDSEGRFLFYPWGVLGKGYVLPDDSKKQEVRQFVSLWYKVSLPAIIVVGMLIVSIIMVVFVIPRLTL